MEVMRVIGFNSNWFINTNKRKVIEREREREILHVISY